MQTEQSPKVEHIAQAVAETPQATLLSEKEVQQKEKLLEQEIQSKYEAIKKMEKDLLGLQFEVQQTTAPKRQALELLRTKITAASAEVKDQRAVAQAKAKELELEVTLLKEKEAVKEALCDELAMLVHQNVRMRYERLESLNVQLKGMDLVADINKGATAGVSEAVQQQLREVVSEAVHLDSVDLAGCAKADGDTPEATQEGTSTPSKDVDDGAVQGDQSGPGVKVYPKAAAAAKAAHVALPSSLKPPGRSKAKSVSTSNNVRTDAAQGSMKLGAEASGASFNGF